MVQVFMDTQEEKKENEDPEVIDKSGVGDSDCGIQVCITCFAVETGHNFEACKLREEIKIMAACKEIEGMIERNNESIEKLDRVEVNLLRILREFGEP